MNNDNTINLVIPRINPDGSLADDCTSHLRSGSELIVLLTPQGNRLLRTSQLCAGCSYRKREPGLRMATCTRQDCDQWYTAEEINKETRA